MLNTYTRSISVEKCISGLRHLVCRRELAEGEQSFCALCESTVRPRFASLFRIKLSVIFSAPAQRHLEKVSTDGGKIKS